ncbi:hypothetical protein H9L10_09255 [Phycicoccus endophyticus]|uniref:HNH nuclease domain-containing protein n=1 Tax=Phycicoccus endophyticus TaxID=1690220 RepID=A0A7G9QYU0_9MICO|nr:HNH endonuclease signature motif containing protein [Phycicoccus endophyticus]NHI20440.1 hypothetical protein [Phycicoccus endophyticus]QNN48515.1 hypothetical protein H9L10_09255 [Phycicoccus endophyticus]GGL30757.1 hypothetical protein GCM10012283_11400 [Phycicoccus endophyticus]
MDAGALTDRIAVLRSQVAELGRELADRGHTLSVSEAFQVAGALQGVVNAAEGAQAVAAAWGARTETTMWESGAWERVHPIGFVDPMAASETSLATGVSEGLAARTVRLGAETSERFPVLRDLILDGSVASSTGHKVLDGCVGLDLQACLRVDAQLCARLPGMDPARVTGETRKVAARVAGEQVAAHAAKTRTTRCVEISPGEDGLTDWFACLPTATSAAMYAAVNELAGEYRTVDDTLSVPESRADALADLVLRNVTVSAQVTLGVPVVTDRPAPQPQPVPVERFRIDRDDEETVIDAYTGQVTRLADLDPASREELCWVVEPAAPGGEVAEAMSPAWSGAAVSGTQLPRLGWVDAATMANLLATLPLEVARAVIDADTGTLASHTSTAYRPPRAIADFVTTRDGTCRMWGCSRPAEDCDLDHVTPWPHGATTPTGLEALCRRHHRLKHRARWRPVLHPDGTITWHGPHGATRTTEPHHRTR